MARCNIAVSSSGVTSYELAALGIPAFLMVTAENQRRNARAFAKSRAAILAGSMEHLKAERLATAIVKLWRNPAKQKFYSRNARKLIDGKGASRLAEAIRKEFFQ